jgi:4-amino-4-deoxy-L-arabinose transferase-like glycosyltransferase
MKKIFILLFVIILIASGLRFYKLGQVPPSPDWDEAALGYNAYSILKTGRDEYGTKLPLSIRSFDDYKPPLYTYLTVPSVALFGLSTWSTRLASVVMGIIAVIGTYALVLELFSIGKEKTKGKTTEAHMLGLLSALLLAISPWHIQFSRIAFEANTGITLNIWAAYAFLVGLRQKIFLPLSAALFALAMYAYHSERVFVPLLVLLFVFVFRKTLFVKANTKWISLTIITGLLVVAPLISVVFDKTALLRLRGTSSFTDQTNLLSRNIRKIEQDRAQGDKIGELLDNRRFVFAKTILDGYLSHFSLRWLFLTGDNARHHAPDMGLLYLWELPFILLGLYTIAKFGNPFVRIIVFGWLFMAPVAAAPTTGLPHAIRTLVFLPVFQIICAVGLVTFGRFMMGRLRHKDRVKKFGYILVLVLVGLGGIFNFTYYLNMYFVHQNSEFSEFWQYGYKEAVDTTEKLKDKYEKVVVSTKLEQSYMFFLFYTKYDPKAYLATGGTKSGSFEEVKNAFDKYEFRSIHWSQEKRDGSILYVGAPSDMPHGNIANISFLDGKPAIEIADRPNGAE